MSRVSSVLGSLGNERGSKNESLVAEVLSGLKERWPWVKGWSKATAEQDRKGIDFVVNTDVGDLYLQVKSSESGKRKFKDTPRKSSILCVVVSNIAHAQGRVPNVLARARAEYKKQRNW